MCHPSQFLGTKGPLGCSPEQEACPPAPKSRGQEGPTKKCRVSYMNKRTLVTPAQGAPNPPAAPLALLLNQTTGFFSHSCPPHASPATPGAPLPALCTGATDPAGSLPHPTVAFLSPSCHVQHDDLWCLLSGSKVISAAARRLVAPAYLVACLLRLLPCLSRQEADTRSALGRIPYSGGHCSCHCWGHVQYQLQRAGMPLPTHCWPWEDSAQQKQ